MTYIISHICGGLGNQMFQYAAGKALAAKLDADFFLDTCWFANKHDDATPRPFLLPLFPNIQIKHATREACDTLQRFPGGLFGKLKRKLLCMPKRPATYSKEPHFAYWPGIEAIHTDAYLEGYWQNERYFAQIAKTIRHTFTFPHFTHAPAHEVAQAIKTANNAISVHIRRGDYVSSPSANAVHGTPSHAYYERAIARLMTDAPDAHLFFFSDDIAWAERMFCTHARYSTFVNIQGHEQSPWNDMHLMSLCKHHIIANSSFSWWGAWLAKGQGTVYGPEKWFAEKKRAGENPCLERWIRL